MGATKGRKSGIILISTFAVGLIVFILSSTYASSSINQAQQAYRDGYRLQAFYEAERGIAYAYYEQSREGFQWYTHDDRTTPAAEDPPETGDLHITSPVIDNGLYCLDDDQGVRRFSVKIFPEKNTLLEETGVIRILARSSIKGFSRTIEYRLGQVSPYWYFFFYPDDHTFSGGIWDGRNYGGIHVNGDIYLARTEDANNLIRNPNFYHLTELACAGPEHSGRGYIRWRTKKSYTVPGDFLEGSTTLRPHYDRPCRTDIGSGDISYPVHANGRALSTSLYLMSQTQYEIYGTNNSYATFKVGPLTDPGDIKLRCYVENAPWIWELDTTTGVSTKYENASDPALAHKDEAHYTISNEALKTLAMYELIKYTGSHRLLSDRVVDVDTVPGMTQGQKNTWDNFWQDWQTDNPSEDIPTEEDEIFRELFDMENDNDNTNDPQNPIWNIFWTSWRHNHGDNGQNGDYSLFPNGNDWERRFFWAAYNWDDANSDQMPDGINREWWEDLQYGSDRGLASNAVVDRYATGIPSLSKYFLNTERQDSAWLAWREGSGYRDPSDAPDRLDERGLDKTLVSDINSGAVYINTGDFFGRYGDSGPIRRKAIEEGIYIGLNDLQTEFLNPLDGFTVGETPILTVKSFYNANCPARDVSNRDGNSTDQYKPSTILQIDLHLLRTAIDDGSIEGADALDRQLKKNLIYVDLTGFPWSDYPAVTHYDDDAAGIMLVNGERLPDGGLSIFTPNNVFIKGAYNVDPVGVDVEPDGIYEREPDAYPEDNFLINVVAWIIAQKPYITQESDLAYQPAEIVTRRKIYALAEHFDEPQVMPLSTDMTYQHYIEDNFLKGSSVDVVDHSHYGKSEASWMPRGNWGGVIDEWAQASGIEPPWYNFESGTEWTQATFDWVEATWGTGKQYFSYDTNDDGKPDAYIWKASLRDQLHTVVQRAYEQEYGLEAASRHLPFTMAHRVTGKHVYNTAIMSPHKAKLMVVERWPQRLPSRKAHNGSYVVLPKELREPSPAAAYHREAICAQPPEDYRYETRFGRYAGAERDRPPSELTFGAESSWNEIPCSDF